MAKFVGTSNINIETDLDVEVYGGGNIAKTEGTTNINVNSRKKYRRYLWRRKCRRSSRKHNSKCKQWN